MAQWRKVIVSGSSAVLNQISASGNIVPTSDNGVDLGSSALEFKDLYIDGTANIDSLVADTADIDGGTVDNATIGANTHTSIKGTTIDATTDFTIDGLVLTADTITNDAALEVVSTGLTFNASLDIALSADGGNVTMDDGTTTIFDFNTDDPEIKIHDDAQVANYASIAVGANGATTFTTVDTDAAAANLIITADGTVDIDSAGALTLDSGAAINIEPAAGSAVLIDGNVSIDGSVITGVSSITSTNFVGILDGALGSVTPSTIVGTTITANTGVVPDANDGAYLGQAGTAFSDLFLAEGGVINWDSGDATLTQASNVVTLAGATLTGTLTNGLSVTANGGILMTSYDASAAVADLALDIDGMTDIGAAPATGDLFIIDDGANGTNRKSTIDRLATKFAGTGLTATSAVIAIDAADTTTTSIINSSLTKIGTNASQEYITFGTSDEVNTFVDNTERLSVTATGIDITGVATVSSNLTVGGNLDVNGTLTTIDTANSYVADKFMIVASGSTSATDGGFIVQGGVTSGYALGYDTGTSRWVLDNNLAHNATDIVPDAYVGTVELGTTHGDLQSAPTYGSGVGSIYVDTDDNEIWIYA
jgi:hypothetical protein